MPSPRKWSDSKTTFATGMSPYMSNTNSVPDASLLSVFLFFRMGRGDGCFRMVLRMGFYGDCSCAAANSHCYNNSFHILLCFVLLLPNQLDGKLIAAHIFLGFLIVCHIGTLHGGRIFKPSRHLVVADLYAFSYGKNRIPVRLYSNHC